MIINYIYPNIQIESDILDELCAANSKPIYVWSKCIKYFLKLFLKFLNLINELRNAV